MADTFDPKPGKVDMQAYKALKALKGYGRWAEIEGMLADRITPQIVAGVVVRDWGYKGATVEGVAEALALHMKTAPPAPSPSVTHGAPKPPPNPHAGVEAQRIADQEELRARIGLGGAETNPLAEMDWLWQLQKGRLQIAALAESRLGVPLPTTQKEVATGVRVLEALANLRMDLGIDKRALGKLQVEGDHQHHVSLEAVRETHGNLAAQVMESPKSRQRVLALVDKFDGLLAKMAKAEQAIDVTPPRDERRTGKHPVRAEDE